MSNKERNIGKVDGLLRYSEDLNYNPIIYRGTDSEIFGDPLNYKYSSDLRLGFINIHSFPRSRSDKLESFKTSVDENMIDVLGLVETNTYWPKVSSVDNIHELTYGWWKQRHVSVAYNRHTCKKKYQPGGCAIVSNDTMIGRKVSSGEDPLKLGRWAWTLYRGKNNIRVRVISLYNALKRSAPGSTTAYMQQLQYLRKNDIVTDPMEKLVEDIIANITAWMSNGEKIILMGDMNEDTINPPKKGLVTALYAVGLKEIIIDRHGTMAPNTYNKGSRPIDGIFVSPTVRIRQGGYDTFNEFTDHRLLWIDVEVNAIFGEYMYRSKRPDARRLRYDDPIARQKFKKKLDEHFRCNNIWKRAKKLNESIGLEMTEVQKKIAEK